jgi:hypothetical protein
MPGDLDVTASLRRFTPGWFVRDDESSGWVTDRYRAHRVPAQVLAWLDSEVGYRIPSCTIDWDEGRIVVDPQPGPPLDRGLRAASWSSTLSPWLVHDREGRIELITGDLQPITVNLDYYRQARADGVVRWTGTTSERPVYGYDITGQLIVVIAPMRLHHGRTVDVPRPGAS